MSKRSRPLQNKRHRYAYIAVITGVMAVGILLLLSGRTVSAAEHIAPSEYQSQFVASNVVHVLLDVRTPEEFASEHIHGSINIPVESLASHLSEVPMDQAIVVYCRSGNRSAKAVEILAQAGYSQLYDLGGLNQWLAQGLPVE